MEKTNGTSLCFTVQYDKNKNKNENKNENKNKNKNKNIERETCGADTVGVR
jgi:hypothetical protein